jgi:protein-disulfide isomerase
MAKFKADINDPEIAKKIDNDYKGGAKGGVNSTPTFFLNGKSIKNPQTYVEFKKIIEDAANSK